MKTLRFATREGVELGRATLDGDTLTCDPTVKRIMAPMRGRLGEVKAFSLFSSGWSNGYAHAVPIE